GWKKLPGAESRHGLDLGLEGWRDLNGQLWLESAERGSTPLPDHAANLAAASYEGSVLDVYSSEGGVCVLSDDPVAGAANVKEWLLNRAGWIDEATLPKAPAPPKPTIERETKIEEEPVRTSRKQAVPWVPLSTLQADGDGPLLVLVHGSTGTPEIYRELVTALGHGRRILGFSARGTTNHEACHPSIEDAAAQYIAALFEEERPENFQLVAFGFGTVVVLEMARQLQAAGHAVPEIVLIGAVPPRSAASGGWLSKMKFAFKRQAPDERIEPLPPENETAVRHLTAWKNYRFTPAEFPLRIILTADVGQEVVTAWSEILPAAEFEFTRSAWSEMLARPAVKRVASILNTPPPSRDPSSEEDHF
ncbi:MAG: alpha/beta fold hydrolase, partial [Verrucomicrobiota bacterium]